VAPPATGKTAPPIPHIAVTSEAPVEEVPPPKKKPEKSRAFKMGVAGAGLAALLVLAGGGYFVWTNYISPPPPPPPPVAAKPKAAAPATAPVTASIATKPAAPLTPSDTANAIAKIPVNAINKTKEVINTRRESGQLDVDAITDGTTPPATGAPSNATKAATAAPATAAPKPVVNSSATLAPGVSATAGEVEAVVEAAPAFRSFVANTKITGVIAGTPSRIILNGRLARAGDVVDSTLGVTFDRIDVERKQLVFKDKTGAVVTKKY
jgi:hypothetical protein